MTNKKDTIINLLPYAESTEEIEQLGFFPASGEYQRTAIHNGETVDIIDYYRDREGKLFKKLVNRLDKV